MIKKIRKQVFLSGLDKVIADLEGDHQFSKMLEGPLVWGFLKL